MKNSYILLITIMLNFFCCQPYCSAQGQIPKSLPQRNPFEPILLGENSQNPMPANHYVPGNTNALPTVPQDSFYHFKLNYIQATEIKEALQGICRSGKISAEPLSNTIMFLGPEKEAFYVKQTINSIDFPSYQVTLEAKILALSKGASKSLGVNWNWDPIPQREDSNSSADNTNSSSTTNNQGNFKFGRGFSFKFGATLNALQSQGKAKILATPRIITLPGKEASIFIGDHIPVQTEQHNSSGTYTSTKYIDAGIKLQYTPIVNKEGTMVTSAVHTEVSTPSLISEIKNYKITSRTADTNVRLKNGETLIIGGLISNEEQKTLQKIPFLGDIPVLGNLFKNHNNSKEKNEVILILTPYITKAGESPAIFQKNYKALQEASILP